MKNCRLQKKGYDNLHSAFFTPATFAGFHFRFTTVTRKIGTSKFCMLKDTPFRRNMDVSIDSDQNIWMLNHIKVRCCRKRQPIDESGDNVRLSILLTACRYDRRTWWFCWEESSCSAITRKRTYALDIDFWSLWINYTISCKFSMFSLYWRRILNTRRSSVIEENTHDRSML